MEDHGHDSEDADLEATSNRLANLSVCDVDRTPLKGIPADSPRIKAGSESENDKDVEAKIHFNKLVKKARKLAQEGKVQEALELNKQALQIHHHEKLAKRIAKMEEYLQNYGGEDEEEDETEGGMVQLGSGFYLHKDLLAKLYNHQKKGVLWMWGLHKQKKGGILGDDMGLGKTIQVIAFLSGLFDMDKVRTVLIVLPVSVMINWEKEFSKWAPGISVYSFHGSKRERDRTLNRLQRRGGVMLTTYGLVLTSYEQLSQKDGRDFSWDYVILDEGHKIKNPSKTTKAVHNVPATHRIILTGTPIQNNLKELWTLFDYVHQGALLGTLRTFKMEFENPIIRARERDATAGEKHLGMEMSQTLKKIIDPYFLMRTKASVNAEEKANQDSNSNMRSIKMPKMTFKNDFVVWLYLSETQLNIYSDFLQLDSVKELLMSSKSPLVALTVLKKICDHPRLLSLRACHQLGMHGQEMQEDELDMPSSMESAVTKIESLDDSVLVGEGGKMGVLVSLVDHLRAEGHRTLIFSQSRKILDIIQKVMKKRGHKVIRLDGTVKGLCERDELVQKFQKNQSYSIFLLTTQVGGVGLTLTAADRVIIYSEGIGNGSDLDISISSVQTADLTDFVFDVNATSDRDSNTDDPSWNPATDAQAVDRAFRIGQTKNVVIYRLITCGTVEEKIYRRQVFKDSITRQATGNSKDPYRYFTKEELRELFQLGDPKLSNTQQQLEELHGLDRRRDPELDNHIAFLHSLDIFGISDHDLMFSQESPAHEMEVEELPAENLPNVQHQQYIMHRVKKAKEIIERESSIPGTMEERMKSRVDYSMPTYSQLENRPQMSGVPVFQPNPADNNRMMLNRPGGGTTIFQPKPNDTAHQMLNRPPAKPPQVVMVYPTKPVVKPVVKSTSSSTSGSSVSEAIDLTHDDNETAPSDVSTGSHPSLSNTEHKPVLLDTSVEEIASQDILPNIEKPEKSGSQSPSDSHTLPPPTSPSPPPPPPSSPSPPPSPSSASAASDDLAEGLPTSAAEMSPPPKPLNLVPDSPLTISQAPDEIASFLAEDDRDTVEDSFIAQDSPDVAEMDSSDSEEVVVKPNRRRSVCRRVALIESSEDEAEEEENKENIDPSFSSVASPYRKGQDEDSDLECEGVDEVDGMYPAQEASPGKGEEEYEEESPEEEGYEEGSPGEEEEEYEEEGGPREEEYEEGSPGEEEYKGEEGASQNVTIYDETLEEEKIDYDGEHEEAVEEQYEEQAVEKEEEEMGEEEVDMDLLTGLLRDGKVLYKQKRFPEALEKCQAALDMMYDPQLEAMVEKIRSKIEAL